MRRHLSTLMIAIMLVMAGCTGTIAGPEADVPDTTTAPGETDGHRIIDFAVGGQPAIGGSNTAGGATGTAPSADVGPDAVSYDGQRYPSVDYGAPASSLTAGGERGTITVSTVGQVSSDPDLAVIHVVVQARADTADDARGEVATDTESMRDAIRAIGIPDDAVETTHYSLSPRYDYTRERHELVGYVASHGFQIRSDVDRVGEVVDTAVGNGADQVTGVQFTLTDETQRELRAEALTVAMGNARSDADAIAAAADVTITGVHSVSTGNVVVIPYAGRLAEAGDGQTALEPGPVTVTASVNVAYEIE